MPNAPKRVYVSRVISHRDDTAGFQTSKRTALINIGPNRKKRMFRCFADRLAKDGRLSIEDADETSVESVATSEEDWT